MIKHTHYKRHDKMNNTKFYEKTAAVGTENARNIYNFLRISFIASSTIKLN